MNVLSKLYDHFTLPLIEAHDKKVKEARKVFDDKRRNQRGHANKFQYKRDCRDLNRIEKQLRTELITKLNRWNWLKKLI
jgi:hypothetical protein